MLSERHLRSIIDSPEIYEGYHASCDGELLGVLVVKKEETNIYSLKTIFVSPEYRRMGVGTRLWKYFEPREAGIIYRPHSSPKELESFLKSLGYVYSSPYEIELTGRFFMSPQIVHPWISKLRPPKGILCSFWKDVPLHIQEKLLATSVQSVYPQSSIVALDQGHAVGWILAHQRAPQHIHYGNTYVHPKYRDSTLVPYLLSQSIMHHYENRSTTPYMSTSIRYPPPKGFTHLAETWGKLAERIDEIRRIIRKKECTQ